jgi:hypothetical protein
MWAEDMGVSRWTDINCLVLVKRQEAKLVDYTTVFLLFLVRDYVVR